MRLVFTATVLLVLSLPARSHARIFDAGTELRIVSETNGELVLEISPLDNYPLYSPRAIFFVAVPPTGSVQAAQSDGNFAIVQVRGEYTVRRNRIVAITSQAEKALGPYQVTIQYPAGAAVLSRAQADHIVREFVVNGDVFPAPTGGTLRSGAATEPGFSMSPNWIKIRVDKRGMYQITGADLIAANVPLSSINNPSTFRMFTGGGLPQSRDFTDGGSWESGNWMEETAILVEDGGDGVFGAGDRVVFYGLGGEGWRDYYEPTSPDSVYYVHPRARSNYYYLTWDGTFGGAPKRMMADAAAPVGGGDRTTYRHREYQEKNLISQFDYRGDGWLWLKISQTGFNEATLSQIQVVDPVPGGEQQFRSIALAPYNTDSPEVNKHHAQYLVTGGGSTRVVGDFRWDTQSFERKYYNGRPVRIESQFLTPGVNVFKLSVPRDENVRDWMYFAWYSVFYERRLFAESNRVAFSSPDTNGTVNYLTRRFPLTGAVYAFDVTEQLDCRNLTGLEINSVGSTREVRFSSTVSGTRRHYWVGTDAGFATLPREQISRSPRRDLRNLATKPNMVIVTASEFLSAANRLRNHRQQHLPGYDNPVVEVVTAEQVYDNFTGGQEDPLAIRNFFKYLYERDADANGNPSLTYGLLFGDATVDFKHYASQRTDWVPAFLYFTPVSEWVYATDAFFGHLDASDQTLGAAANDVCIGRLPAASRDEATALANKVIGYETGAPFTDWRNRIVLVADDEVGAINAGSCFDQIFTEESEVLAYYRAPQYLDVEKVYLTEYERVSTIKPDARFALLELWNQGTSLVNYIGHGSSQQMADEQVFLDSDISLLNNGSKLPVLLALSCTIGDFANPLGSSLSERLLLRSAGGAIATITASNLSYVTGNERLDYSLLETLFRPSPRKLGVSFGEGVLVAQIISLVRASLDPTGQEDNNWKYNALGDPALEIAAPKKEIRLVPAQPDTMVAGIRKTLRGAVYDGSSVDTGFNGTVNVRVREPDIRRAYITACSTTVNYRYPGGVLFDATTDVTAGQFEISFRVPRFARTGNLAYITAYAENTIEDAGMSADSLLSLLAPTPADSLALRPVDGPPRVTLGFKSGLKVVKPGESLQAVVRDQDGVNILSTTNAGKQSLLLDDSPVPLDVTEYFEFDYGGTDTSGVLVFPLPDLAVGNHHAVYKVSDSFGQTTLDTLRFSVTDPLDFFAEAVMNYPNPFRTTTQFFFRLSDRASIRLDIFTVSGKRIRRIEEVQGGGEAWVFWDGRDAAGEEIANGTYLYVATVDFYDTERTPLKLRGKVSKIE